MAKLYFKYGVMGASKSAQALITKYNYEKNGKKVLLLKPATDNRDGADIIRSRIGLSSEATIVKDDTNLFALYALKRPDVIIADESQFFSEITVDALHEIASVYDVPVICYGLLTDFQTNLFPGSKRLIETAESIKEIQMTCKCGRKATINARINSEGDVITDGEQVVLGGDETYEAMCYLCYRMKTLTMPF